MVAAALVIPALLAWVFLLLLPWRPWSTRERLDSGGSRADADFHAVTVLIPARNEADCLAHTLRSLRSQGAGLQVIVVDDESDDATVEVAAASYGDGLTIVPGSAPPPGWSGKLWALEQGRSHVTTPYLLLLDADVVLAPGMVAALLAKMRDARLDVVSVMVELRWKSVPERLLLPAFVYFFKLLYPFGLANDARFPRIAAAAGGCLLVRADALQRAGGFGQIRSRLIDDCALAGRVKENGGRIWVGLTHSAHSRRTYGGFKQIRDLIARCAFAQLQHSTLRLLALTLLFVLVFWVPVAALAVAGTPARALGSIALGAMMLSYGPTLRYYGMSPLWCIAMPLIATFYLASSWYSAIRFWRGQGSEWKGRAYLASGSQ